MSIIRPTTCGVLAAIGLVASPLALGESFSVGADFDRGDTLTYRVHSEATQAWSGTIGEGGDFLRYTVAFDLRVMSKSDTYTDIKMVFTDVKVEATGFDFDSSRPPGEGDDESAAAFEPLIGAPFSVRLDEAREIIGITTPVMDNLPEPGAGMARAVLGERQLTPVLQPIFRLKEPPLEVSEGDTWQLVHLKTSRAGSLATTLDHEVHGVEDGTARIALGGTLELRRAHDTPVSERITKQKIEGLAVWSIDDTCLESLEIEKHMVVEAGDERLSIINEVNEAARYERVR